MPGKKKTPKSALGVATVPRAPTFHEISVAISYFLSGSDATGGGVPIKQLLAIIADYAVALPGTRRANNKCLQQTERLTLVCVILC